MNTTLGHPADLRTAFEERALSRGESIEQAVPGWPSSGYRSVATQAAWQEYQKRFAFEATAKACAHDLAPNEHFPGLYKDPLTQCAWNGFEWGWRAAKDAEP